MSDRRVLIVSYDFPPAGGSGVQRALKLARYLPEHGWTPTILCCGHDRQPLHDDSLLDDLPADADLVRLPGWEPCGLTHSIFGAVGPRSADRLHHAIDWRFNFAVASLGLPELQLLWSLAACRAAIDLARSRRIAAVVTSGPPHSVHLVGRYAQSRLGLPWVADLRDPIVSNFGYRPANRVADYFWRKLESAIVRSADRIVVTCDDLAQDLCDRHPPLGRAAFETITNGWDPADFIGPEPSRTSSSTLNLTYVGAFYREQSIDPYLEAFRRLLARRSDLRSRLRFEHVGSLSREQTRLLRPTDDEFLIRRGYADHASAIAAMRRAAALLLTVPPTPGGRLCIPAKTFEYLATDRPILAFAHPGTHLADLLARAGGVSFLQDLEPETIAARIEQMADQASPYSPSIRRAHAILRDCSRPVVAARYADLLNHTTGHPRLPISRAAAQYWQLPRYAARPRIA